MFWIVGLESELGLRFDSWTYNSVIGDSQFTDIKVTATLYDDSSGKVCKLPIKSVLDEFSKGKNIYEVKVRDNSVKFTKHFPPLLDVFKFESNYDFIRNDYKFNPHFLDALSISRDTRFIKIPCSDDCFYIHSGSMIRSGITNLSIMFHSPAYVQKNMGYSINLVNTVTIKDVDIRDNSVSLFYRPLSLYDFTLVNLADIISLYFADNTKVLGVSFDNDKLIIDSISDRIVFQVDKRYLTYWLKLKLTGSDFNFFGGLGSVLYSENL